MANKQKSQVKAPAVVGGSAIVLSYAAMVVSAKWKIPYEVVSVAFGGVFTYLGAWAGKLMPKP